MLRNWPLLFIIIPLVELYLIITVGEYIGALWTVILVLATAVVGVRLLRYQGMSTLARAQRNMAQGTLPAMEMMEGVVLAVGGVLLITPGFLTDTLGFLCLIPVTRKWLIQMIASNMTVRTTGRFHSGSSGFEQTHQPRQGETFYKSPNQPKNGQKSSRSTGRIIEGECRHDD